MPAFAVRPAALAARRCVAGASPGAARRGRRLDASAPAMFVSFATFNQVGLGRAGEAVRLAFDRTARMPQATWCPAGGLPLHGRRPGRLSPQPESADFGGVEVPGRAEPRPCGRSQRPFCGGRGSSRRLGGFATASGFGGRGGSPQSRRRSVLASRVVARSASATFPAGSSANLAPGARAPLGDLCASSRLAQAGPVSTRHYKPVAFGAVPVLQRDEAPPKGEAPATP